MGRILAYAKETSALFEQGANGEVHSAYRHTVNVRCGDALISLQPNGVPMTPISVTLDLNEEQFAAIQAQQGDLVILGSHGIILWNQALSRKGAECVDFRLQQSCPAISAQALELIARALKRTAGESGFGDLVCQVWTGEEGSLSRCASYGRQSMAELVDAARAGQWQQAAHLAAGLIGLGDGLTPSGDDFCVGLLAGTLLLREREQMKKWYDELCVSVNRGAGGTNDVSRAFLEAACGGRFSQPLLALLEALAAGAPLEEPLEQLLRVGHSSGADTLGGLWLALSLSAEA